ncbi:MAG: TetR/AcrR family transcriptional regulator [Treponema sp.]|nr:TetR/AcrR family transcriptional regulator [Treponema sp.]
MQKSTSNNRQVQRTKSWIFEALMILMDEKSYDKITVSDIVEKAGIARQTFYRNFNDKNEVIFECARNADDLSGIETSGDSKKSYQIVLMFNYNYTIKRRKELKKILSVHGIENHILRGIQDISPDLLKPLKESLSKEEYRICRYKLCYQITGCRRVFLDWFLDDMPLPVDNLVSMMNAMNVPQNMFYRNLPCVVVRINKE